MGKLGMGSIIGYLSSNDALMHSPVFIGLALIIILRLTTKHGQYIWKRLWKYAKSGIIAWGAYILVGFVWRNYFPQFGLYFGVETWLSWLAVGLNIYIMYLAYQFLKRSNKSIQLLWTIIPFALILFPNLVDWVKSLV